MPGANNWVGQSRLVCVDLWAIHRNSHGHSQSQRRPVSLVHGQLAMLDTHPTIKERLQKLPRRKPEYHVVALELKATKARLADATKKPLRKEWTVGQAVEDIEQQIRSVGFAKPFGPASRPRGEEHQRLVDAPAEPC